MKAIWTKWKILPTWRTFCTKNSSENIPLNCFSGKKFALDWNLPNYIFSLLCTEKYAMCLVPNKKSNNVLPLIESTCKDKTILYTDKWKWYNRVNSFLCALFTGTVNRSENFINPQDGTHTQAIESLWSKFKKQIKNTNGIAGDKLESLLFELMYENNECVFAGFEAVLILLRKN